MKKFIAFAVVAALAVVAGCAKKTATPTANANLTEVAPPPPIHNGITPAAPISYSEPIAAPMDDITPSTSRSGRYAVGDRAADVWGWQAVSQDRGRQPEHQG